MRRELQLHIAHRIVHPISGNVVLTYLEFPQLKVAEDGKKLIAFEALLKRVAEENESGDIYTLRKQALQIMNNARKNIRRGKNQGLRGAVRKESGSVNGVKGAATNTKVR